jgi:hypothetical protein
MTDFAVSFVSLEPDNEMRLVRRGSARIRYVLDDIKRCEQHELSFFVLTHALDVRFKNLDYVFAILGEASQSTMRK